MSNVESAFWRRNWRGWGAVLLLTGFLTFHYYPRAPIPFSTVEGTYSNPCCDSIRLADGAIWLDNERVPIRLAQMKFGLVAEIDREIVVRSHRVKANIGNDTNGQYIEFDEDHRGFTLYENYETGYHFSRR